MDSPTSASPHSARRGPRLRIVSVNDVYSLENLPRLATLIARWRASREDRADAFLAILAGDFVAPSMLSSLDRGRGMVACLNATGITHVTFGNHEDDIPVAELHRRIAELDAKWLGTNLRGFDPAAPAHDVVGVTAAGGRTVRVGLVGVVMADPAVYRRAPFGGAVLEPANASVLVEAETLMRSEACALVIPITHQSIASDRALVRAAAALGLPLPLIVGGHEHDVHLEHDDGTVLVKAGSDAERAAIIELEWLPDAPSSDGPPGFDLPSVTARFEPVAGYPEDVELRARVDGLMRSVHELEQAVLLPLAPGETLSSVGARARQTSIGTLVCSRVRDALGADVCLLNGGAIRVGREYRGQLAFGDIKSELPFDNEMVVARMPGQALSGAVAWSRARAPAEYGGFLQVDDGVEVDAGGRDIVSVGGRPLEVAREYKVAIPRSLFAGMDDIEPLVAYAATHPREVPAATTGRDLKETLVLALALALWNRLGGFAALDADGDGRVTEQDISAALAKLTGELPSSLTVTLVMNAVDQNHDHLVTRDEAALVVKDGPAGGPLPNRNGLP